MFEGVCFIIYYVFNLVNCKWNSVGCFFINRRLKIRLRMNFWEFLFLVGFLCELGVFRIGDFRKYYIVKWYYWMLIV